MESYCIAKQKLFKSLGAPHKREKRKRYPKIAIVNADSPWKDKIIEGCSCKIMTYGIDSPADLRATDIKMTSTHTFFNLIYKGQPIACTSPLVGRYNVYNVLAACATMLAKEYTLESIAPIVSTFHPVPGRLERVKNALDLKVYVDFAHSDDALTNVLECLRELNPKRIITIFGCGGDRDQTKRPKMAQAAEELSDLTIVTSDNPRSENPAVIAQHILKGFRRKDSHMVELDRYKAIEHAISIASPEDIVLIAGKGHESHQIFAHKIVEFDDRKVAAQICLNTFNSKGKHG